MRRRGSLTTRTLCHALLWVVVVIAFSYEIIRSISASKVSGVTFSSRKITFELFSSHDRSPSGLSERLDMDQSSSRTISAIPLNLKDGAGGWVVGQPSMSLRTGRRGMADQPGRTERCSLAGIRFQLRRSRPSNRSRLLELCGVSPARSKVLGVIVARFFVIVDEVL